MSQPPPVPPFINAAMGFVLRSPLHGLLSKSLLLITFTGRKSGKTYTTPVNYYQSGDQVTIFSHAQWWKNLREDTPVTLRLRGKDVQGSARAEAADKQAVAAGLADCLRQAPGDVRYYGVTFDSQGNLDMAEMEKAVQRVAMISIRLG